MPCFRIIFPEPEEIFLMEYNIFTINVKYNFLNEGGHFFMQRKTCIIIGNGDLPRDLSAQINATDYVLRFNRPRALGGWSGNRTNRLMICNSGKPMQLMLKDTGFLNSDFIKNTRDIVFVYHPAIMRRYFKKPLMTSRLFHGRKVDWTYEGIDILGRKGKPATVLPPEFYLAACREIGISGDTLYRQFPSTGYLGIWDLLQQLPPDEWQIKLCGFNWQGWKRHNWERERNWIAAKINNCTLSIIE
jgi:hypothetical protein